MNAAARTDFDTELRRHNQALRQACGIQVDDHVLDIGCGTGQTTRQAAGTARAGSALGVDTSAPAIERARELAGAAELHNAAFEHADAQVHRFPREHFDVAISRFGTMFFGDPVAAFTNIGRAIRPAGRLAMLVWQPYELNEWAVAVRRALQTELAAAVAAEGPDPFSLADPPTTTDVLEAAGFTHVTFTDVDEPVYYGPHVDAAFEWVSGFSWTSETLQQLDPAAATRTIRRLRETFIAHTSHDGVWFGSRAWLVTAHRRGRGT